MGRAGFAAIKDRQCDRKTECTPAISASLDLIDDLFKMQLRREYWLAAS